MRASCCGGKMKKHNIAQYWRRNISIVIGLLSIWWLVSYGAGLFFADFLNSFHLGGYPLGFWFAQQGSIFVFVILIYVYVFLMKRLDKEFDLED